MAALGLVEVARQNFSLSRSERFGVRAVKLTLLFLTLAGKPTVLRTFAPELTDVQHQILDLLDIPTSLYTAI